MAISILFVVKYILKVYNELLGIIQNIQSIKNKGLKNIPQHKILTKNMFGSHIPIPFFDNGWELIIQLAKKLQTLGCIDTNKCKNSN